ncbi:MAG: SLBB domain-containing protein [Pseudomonadota bacterium]
MKTLALKTPITILLLLLCYLNSSNSYSGDPIPMLDSLSLEQQKIYLRASPSGQDKAISSPIVSQIISSQRINTPSEIEKTIAQKLTTISLDEKIQKQLIQPSLEQFGYDLFNNVPSTFVPVTNIPVPPDYIIGPGDTLIVQLYGKTNVEYRLVVTREGKILVPDLGPVIVSGLSFSEVKGNLKNRFEKNIFGTKAAITIGELRTINIMIVGDVVNPGQYTISGLSNLMNALLVSGGVKRTGSLRDIQLKRNGKIISRFDLYNVLLYGNTHSDAQLAHGDVIFVPAIGKTVGVGGEVQRPAIYEFKGSVSFAKIIKLAGGLLPTASLESSHIERIKSNQYHTLISLDLSKNKLNRLKIASGDLVRILPVKKMIDDIVLLSGHVIQPGAYQFKENMRVSDILSSSAKLRQNVDIKFALLRRELRKQRRIEARYIDLERVLNQPGSKADLKLQRRDEIILFNLSKNREKSLAPLVQDLKIQSTPEYPPMVFTINGYVRNTGTFPLQYAARLLDVLKVAGGIQAGTDLSYVLIARKKYPDNNLELFSLDLNKAKIRPDSEWNPIIHPEDSLYVFNSKLNRSQIIQSHIEQLKKQTRYGDIAPIVSIEGKISHQGDYPLEPGMRVAQLIKAAGGLYESSYGISAELTRYQLIDGQYQIAEHKYIDLNNILAGNKKYNLILQPHDHLTIFKKPQWQDKRYIELFGEVKFPGKYPINNNETLCNVMQRAGGLTNKAYTFGSIFTRVSVQKKQQLSLDRIQGEFDDLLVKLHLSPSAKNNEKMPADEEMHQMNNVIRKLKKAKASGRMNINMDKILLCDEEADILLENGDRLTVPEMAYEVSVYGEVYHSTTHIYNKNKGSQEYIDLSGGTTKLANSSHAYVIQANGEVLSVRKEGWFSSWNNIPLKPGASIYVPIDIDRSNNRETLQSWTEIMFRLTLSAAGISAIL